MVGLEYAKAELSVSKTKDKLGQWRDLKEPNRLQIPVKLYGLYPRSSAPLGSNRMRFVVVVVVVVNTQLQ